MKVSVEGGRLAVQTPRYDNDLYEWMMRLPKADRQWDGDNSRWLLPATHYDDLAFQFPFADYGSEVESLVSRLSILEELSDQAEDNFFVPNMLRQPYPYQRAGVRFLDVAGGRALNADEMGLGKSIQMLGYLALHPELRPAVIVCPASLKSNWVKEIRLSLAAASTYNIISGRKATSLPNADIQIINYDILGAHVDDLIALRPQFVGIDEAHYCASATAQRTKAVQLLAGATDKVVELTGTPISSRPRELYPLLNILDPARWNSFFSFAHSFCDAKQIQVFRKGKGQSLVWDFSGHSNLDELHRQLKPYMIRRLKRDVLTDLPPKQWTTVPIDLPAAIYKEYRRVYEETQAIIEDAIDRYGGITHEAITQLTALRQQATLCKLPVAFEWINDRIEGGEKLVLFFWHTFVADALKEQFGDRIVLLTGETPQKRRQQVVDRFQEEDTLPLFGGQIKAAGVGHTLTSATNVAFLELPWTPSDFDQCSDRLHRIGQRGNVHVWSLLARGTVDYKMYGIVRQKAKVFGAVVDGVPLEDGAGLTERQAQVMICRMIAGIGIDGEDTEEYDE